MIQSIVDRIVQTPERIALLNEEGACELGLLGARCQGIMEAIGDSPKGTVLIYGHKEMDSVAAMLAATLVGRPFVFVDIANPWARVVEIAAIAEAQVLICARPPAGRFAGVVLEASSIASRVFSISRFGGSAGALFCVVFTSGSTGAPKGVQIGGDCFGHFFRWYGAILQGCLGSDAHVNHASLSFDMGMLDLWPSLAVGKSVIMLDHRNNPLTRANIRLLTRSAHVMPGSWFSTPTFLEMMCKDAWFDEARLPRLRSIFIGGEPVQQSLVLKLMERFPSAEIWHAYGPTEVTCLTHCVRLTPQDLATDGPLPLGRPWPPTEVRVLDRDGCEVAPGEHGDIELTGPQVARGYLPKEHPRNSAFGIRDGTAFYRTGDYGTVDRYGILRVNGRKDGQLKWKGNRIEVAEIERAAHSAPGICQAALVPRLKDNRVTDLVLFVRLSVDHPEARSAFVAHLAKVLPAYMRPRSIRFVDCLPMSLHGKHDRAQLATEIEPIPSPEP